MPTTYQFQPLFGAELFKRVGDRYSDAAGSVVDANGEYGGGAEITHNNFLIALFSATDFTSLGVPIEGALLQPIYSDLSALGALPPGISPSFITEGFKPEFDSRLSSKFLLLIGDTVAPDGWDPTFYGEDQTGGVLAVLQPPDELRKIMAESLILSLNPNSIAGVNISSKIGNILGSFAIEARAEQLVLGNGAYKNAPSVSVAVGAAAGGLLGGGLPLLKTSGADGTYPEFFPNTAAGKVEQYETLRDGGEWYLPALINYDWAQPGNGKELLGWVSVSAAGDVIDNPQDLVDGSVNVNTVAGTYVYTLLNGRTANAVHVELEGGPGETSVTAIPGNTPQTNTYDSAATPTNLAHRAFFYSQGNVDLSGFQLTLSWPHSTARG
jgi:hypothetical protein